jgi:chemotaxis protein CheD
MSQQIVGIAELQVSNNETDTLVTYSLGSCIGLAIYDPEARVGGMIHYMLPNSSLDSNQAEAKPAMFADTGIPLLFEEARELGLSKKRVRTVVAGAAQIMDDSGFFNIGERNYQALHKMRSPRGAHGSNSQVMGSESYERHPGDLEHHR